MGILYIAGLLIGLVGERGNWLSPLFFGVACMRALYFCGSTGLLRVAGVRIDKEERSDAVSSALCLWMIAAFVLAALSLAVAYTPRADGNLLARIDMRWPVVVMGSAFFALAQTGFSMLALRGSHRARKVLMCLCPCVLLGAFLLPGMQLIVCAAGFGVVALIAVAASRTKPGRIRESDLRAICRAARPEAFVQWVYVLPGAALCLWRTEALPAYLAAVAWIDWVGSGRRDANESERLLAGATLYAGVILLALVWAGPAMSMPNWAALLFALGMAISLIPTLHGRWSRYAVLLGLLWIGTAAGNALPFPYAGVVAPILIALSILLLRRALYAAWLPIRARLTRRRL